MFNKIKEWVYSATLYDAALIAVGAIGIMAIIEMFTK